MSKQNKKWFPRLFQRWSPFLTSAFTLIALLLFVDQFLFAATIQVEIKKLASEKQKMILASKDDLAMKVGDEINLSSQCHMKVEQAAKKEILVHFAKCDSAKEFKQGLHLILNSSPKVAMNKNMPPDGKNLNSTAGGKNLRAPASSTPTLKK